MKVLSSLALKGVLEKFRGDLGDVDLRFDATQAILEQLHRGERADVLILTAEAIETLSVRDVRRLGSSGVGVAVRSGAPRPDISTVDALKRALLEAQSVAHSKVGASGIYFSEVLEHLGIADKLKQRIIVEKGPVGLVVARGEAEIGVQQLCELAPVAGIDIIGPLPDPLQKMTHFAAAISAQSPHRRAAIAFMEFLASGSVRSAMQAGGIQPAAH
jgi:molybdate transport system substrate-binding protein